MGGSISVELTETSTGVVIAWAGDINTFAHGTPTCTGLAKSISNSQPSEISFDDGFVLKEENTDYLLNDYTLPNTNLYQVVDAKVDGCGTGTFPLSDIVNGPSMFGFRFNEGSSFQVYAPNASPSSDPKTDVSGSALIAGQTLTSLGFAFESECYFEYIACSGESGYAGGPKTETISLNVVWPTEVPSAIPSETPSTSPSESPSTSPSESPSAMPTDSPSAMPSLGPSLSPLSAITNPTETPDTSCQGFMVIFCFIGDVATSTANGITGFFNGIIDAILRQL